jgi:predicted tellurium resistance membrane protein TerC
LGLFEPFLTAEGWLSLLTLIFLELVLGIDNLVFIAITTDRLPESKKHLGRRFGLVAALIMRLILLSLGFLIIHLEATLFTLPFGIPGIDPAINARDLILLLGGAYLIYKGFDEIFEKISLKEIEHEQGNASTGRLTLITLPQAIGTIALMDMIFSLDSVITALGMSGNMLIMSIAVMSAVAVMIIFADPISEFINANPGMKILALAFIIAVGVKLVMESLGIEFIIEGTEIEAMDLMLYFAMFLSLAITCIQMFYNSRAKKARQERNDSARVPEQGQGGFVRTPEVKILAVAFIVVIGIKFVIQLFGINLVIEDTKIEAMDLIVYFALFFSLAITCVQMLYNSRVKKAQSNRDDE